jgi:hypothetical protein
MASERQIAANRRNAQKSTGPRSVAGKERASRNAYRHGFAAGVHESHLESVAIEAQASSIAIAATRSPPPASDPDILEHARVAARAERALVKICASKAGTIQALIAIAQPPPGEPSQITGCHEPAPELSVLYAMDSREASPSHRHAAMLPGLTMLLTLERYDRRARARRDRAIMQIMAQHLWENAVGRCR